MQIARVIIVVTVIAVITALFPGSAAAEEIFSGENTEKPGKPLKFERESRSSYSDHWARNLERMFRMADKGLYNGHILLKLSDRLELTEDQIHQIEELMLNHEEKVIRKSAEIKITELRIARIFHKDSLNRKEAEKQYRALSKKKTSLIIDHLNHLLDLREQLTPKQLNTLRTISDERKQKQRKQREERKRKWELKKKKNKAKKSALIV